MSVATTAGVPGIITAGDTLIFDIGPDATYPNTGWTLKFVLSRDGKNLGTWAAANSATGLGFTVTMAVDGSKIAPGPAQWAELYTETASGQRQTGCSGIVTIAPDPLMSLPQSEAGKALEAANKTRTAILSDPSATVNFNGQSFEYHNLDSLQKIIDRLKIIVNNELRSMGAGGKPSYRQILTRFR